MQSDGVNGKQILLDKINVIMDLKADRACQKSMGELFFFSVLDILIKNRCDTSLEWKTLEQKMADGSQTNSKGGIGTCVLYFQWDPEGIDYKLFA